MTRICFVCHGNICRSPMAEYTMRHLAKLAAKEGEIAVSSAATSAEETGNPVYPPAARELTKHGIGCDGHRARRLTAADYEQHDMFIGMDGENLRSMVRLFGGDPEGKVSLLLDHTDHPHDVADPWYTGDFAKTWNDVLRGCKALIDELG